MVVPFFNVAAYAHETLRSLQRNAAPDVEFLLVDDGSQDQTGAILARQAERLPGARVITHDENRGLSAARNTGLREARGRYVTFLDGDDFVAAGYYNQLADVIERLGCDMVRTDHVQVVGRERSVHRICFGPRATVARPRDGIAVAKGPTSVDAPYAWAGVYDRKLVDNGLLFFDETLRTCEDRPWIWRLHLSAETFAVVELTGLFYRRDVSTSLSRLTDHRQFVFIEAYDQIMAMVLTDPEVDRFLPKAVRSYCGMVCHHLDRVLAAVPELTPMLTELSRDALRRLPRPVLRSTMDQLKAQHRDQLTAVLAA